MFCVSPFRATPNPVLETFFKYQGIGNDFVVIDRRESAMDVDEVMSRRLCDRHYGIGADGVLAILPEAGTAGRMWCTTPTAASPRCAATAFAAS